MTYEHRPGGYPASPDVDVGVPELCQKCSRDCFEPCEAFKRLEAVKTLEKPSQLTGVFSGVSDSDRDYIEKWKEYYDLIQKILEGEE